MRAGKVWMEFDDGTSGWVPAHNVRKAVADGGKVKMKASLRGGDVVREFQNRDIPNRWMEQGEFMGPDDATQGASFGQAFGNQVRSLPGEALRGAGQVLPGMIPGAGLPAIAARFGAGILTNATADVGARAMEGQPQDLGGSLTYGGMSSALGLPFEAAATMLPKKAPGMMATAMRPTKSQQMKAQQVESRQSGQKAPPDYDRLGQQALDEGVRPTKKGGDAKALRGKNDRDNMTAEDILDEADALGFEITAPQLVRSPQVREVMKELSKQTNAKEAIRQGNAFLKTFMRDRASRGVRPKPTGVLNSRGNMTMTRGTPAVPHKIKASGEKGLNEQKRTWRKESTPVMKARAKGEPSGVGPQQSIDDRLSDALARAAKARLDAIQVRRPDPENPRAMMGFKDLNERIERRIPLAEVLEDFQTRSRPTIMERLGRLSHLHAPSPEFEGLLAQRFYDPRFGNLRHAMRAGLGVASLPRDPKAE